MKNRNPDSPDYNSPSYINEVVNVSIARTAKKLAARGIYPNTFDLLRIAHQMAMKRLARRTEHLSFPVSWLWATSTNMPPENRRSYVREQIKYNMLARPR